MLYSVNNHGFNRADSFRPCHQPALGSCGGNAKSDQSLDDLLIRTGKGGAMLNPDKKELLEKVAAFMDKNPEIFGKPHGRDTWLSELKEDNFLNGREACKFAGAIDMIKDATGGGNVTAQAQPQGQPHATSGGETGGAGKNFDNALIPAGNGESYLNPSKKGELEDIAKFMDQHPEIFGKPHGADSWLSELKENNHLNKGETKEFNKAIDLLKDAQGAMGGNQTQAPSQNYSAPVGNNYNAQGQGQGAQGGLDLKNAIVETGKGDAYLNPSKKAELESIAKYMDQHPEVFGKPHGQGTWLSELKEDNYLSKSETKDFKKAIDMMQDAQSAAGAGGAAQPGNNYSPSASAPVANAAPAQTQGQGQSQPLNLKDVLVPTGKGDAYLNPSKKEELESVAKFMDQHPEIFGKPHGKDSWLSELKEDNYLSKNETKDFQKAIDMMQDAQSATGTASATTSGNGAPAPVSTPNPVQSSGVSDTKTSGNSQNLDDILVQTGKGDAYFNPSKKTELEGVAKYMDQHPEIFGKPHGTGTWLSELKEDNYLSSNENKAFSKAIDMMKDARGA